MSLFANIGIVGSRALMNRSMRQPPEPDCTLERIVCGLMLYSDSTHLASFGSASLWPLYMYFGNQSKYVRVRPSSGSCHHVAYIPKLPDNFHDWYLALTGEGPSADLLTHCRRELMHGVLDIVLDDDFLMAYKHGIVLKMADGIIRRLYPRLFTYSADYPEKVLLATVRNLGKCPCVRCTVTKDQIKDIGTANDFARRKNLQRISDYAFQQRVRLARSMIYDKGKGIKSAVVEGLLSPLSYVPTTNTFSKRLGDFINIFTLFVVDLLHEIELGVWKALFIHLVRILVSLGGDGIQQFNERFRQVSTFGRSTIRAFHQNASGMKKLAARDFEDLLQCILPVIEGLLPDSVHNTAIQNLLFVLAEWHANAKLRIHTTSSVANLRELTRQFGIRIRHFTNHVCPAYDTRELPKEEAARLRRQAKQGENRSTKKPESATPTAPKTSKRFHLKTYKLHAMGDYVDQIIQFGTTDSYSTQPGELEHRSVKRYYRRTNKIDATRQIARIHRRERILQKALAQRRSERTKLKESNSQKSINDHHYISPSRNFPVRLIEFNHCDDLRFQDVHGKLLNHLVSRLRFPDSVDDGTVYTSHERAQVQIVSGRMFAHKTMQVNYTSYDMRRDYDIINPNKHADIMTVSLDFDPSTGTSDSGHAFRYARVLGIYHAEVVHVLPGQDPTLHTVQLLWVHWYQRDTSHKAGFHYRRLHRLEPMSIDDPSACGFVDPDDVIRGIHLIPAFAHGKQMYTDTQSAVSEGLPLWKYYYVNNFVDRDMYMRFKGGGIGHVVSVDVADPIPEGVDALDIGDDVDMDGDGLTGDGRDNGGREDDVEEDEEENEEDEEDDNEGDNADDEEGVGLDDEDNDLDGNGLEDDGDQHLTDMLNDTLGYDTL
ncbi:hypothetical protein QCA50_000867 [Cerrena zonata]|uniref:Uncharacterized protein n=1 Tax=Cerrena zonata TaxID=2478898 RepID=A0AAW0GXG9_9APHY